MHSGGASWAGQRRTRTTQSTASTLGMRASPYCRGRNLSPECSNPRAPVQKALSSAGSRQIASHMYNSKQCAKRTFRSNLVLSSSQLSLKHRGIKCRHGKFRKLLQLNAWSRQCGKTRKPQIVLAEQVTTLPLRKFRGIERPGRKFHKLPQLKAWARQCKANKKTNLAHG